jgi:putative endonuclease
MIATSSGWVCYLLECGDGTLYCGITNGLEKRLAAHNAGVASKFTRARLPVKLVYAESCADRSAASKRESEIKQMTRSGKLKLCAGTSSPSEQFSAVCGKLPDRIR